MSALGIHIPRPIPYATMATVQDRLVADRIRGDIQDLVFSWNISLSLRWGVVVVMPF